MFEVIPVIDLLSGVVVHGKGGKRDEYRPVQSSLCQGADPHTVVEALLTLYPFRTCYVADLDAIQGGTPNNAVIESLLERFEKLTLWCDAGLTNSRDLDRCVSHARLRHIVGSETVVSEDELAALCQGSTDPVLSIDFRGEEFLGVDTLLSRPAQWPQQVIVLNLVHVGASSGPPHSQLATVAAQIEDRQRLIAGGGVRDAADLRHLREDGYGGALVATALHAQSVTFDELKDIME